MATFALIHGGGGSAWDWHLVARELREDAHDPTAVDLPCEDESADWWDYADAVVEAIGDRSDVVVVGHSLGGFTAPLVCARIPVDLLVLVAAMIPSPGELFDDWWANSRYEASDYDDVFYHDVHPDLAAEAQRRERDETSRALREPWPLAAWPGTPTRYLLCRDDRMFPAAWARRHARERLGIAPDEMDGGHYISLSRPRELAERLSAYAAEIAHVSAGARRSKRDPPRTPRGRLGRLSSTGSPGIRQYAPGNAESPHRGLRDCLRANAHGQRDARPGRVRPTIALRMDNGLVHRATVAERDINEPQASARKHSNQAVSSRAEGEGFEPSIRLTTDNGFRDRLEMPLCREFCFGSPVGSPARALAARGPVLARRSADGGNDLARTVFEQRERVLVLESL